MVEGWIYSIFVDSHVLNIYMAESNRGFAVPTLRCVVDRVEVEWFAVGTWKSNRAAASSL
jgi:hypothetical protein